MNPDAPVIDLNELRIAADLDSYRNANNDEAGSNINLEKTAFNVKDLQFWFREEDHKMVVAMKTDSNNSISPSMIERILTNIFRKVYDGDEQYLSVTVQPLKFALDDVLSGGEIRNIEITIDRPNADIESADELCNLLAEQKAKRTSISLDYASGEGGLEIDKNNRSLAEIAAVTGEVKSSRYLDNDGVVKRNTKDYPDIWKLKVHKEFNIDDAALSIFDQLDSRKAQENLYI